MKEVVELGVKDNMTNFVNLILLGLLSLPILKTKKIDVIVFKISKTYAHTHL